MCSQLSFLPLRVQTTILSHSCGHVLPSFTRHCSSPFPFPTGKNLPMEQVPREAVTLQFTSLLPPGRLLMCAHTKREAPPMGTCIHNSFPLPAEKLHYSKGGIETTTTFLEIVLSPKRGDAFLGKNHSPSQSDPWFLVEVKSIQEVCYLLQVNSEYVLTLRVSQNFMEKIVIRTVKISRCPEQVFTLGSLIMLIIVKDGKLILPLFWLSQTLWFSYAKWVHFHN